MVQESISRPCTGEAGAGAAELLPQPLSTDDVLGELCNVKSWRKSEHQGEHHKTAELDIRKFGRLYQISKIIKDISIISSYLLSLASKSLRTSFIWPSQIWSTTRRVILIASQFLPCTIFTLTIFAHILWFENNV